MYPAMNPFHTNLRISNYAPIAMSTLMTRIVFPGASVSIAILR